MLEKLQTHPANTRTGKGTRKNENPTPKQGVQGLAEAEKQMQTPPKASSGNSMGKGRYRV